ncbi:unnamed protein product, partial [Hapterophycus canaliculatus]
EQAVEINESEKSVCVRDVERPTKSIDCAFDKVFGRKSTQEDVFDGLVPALDTVVKGFNACVLAYGQTGSGKTHTLIGPGGGTRLPDDQMEWGIIPRAVQFLFDRLNLASEEDETFSYSVTCSFLQIYNENLVDLLLQDGGAAASNASLQIREEAGGAGLRKKAGAGGGDPNGGRNRYRSEAVRDVEDAASGMEGGGRTLGVVGHREHRPISKPNGARAIDNRRVFVNGLSSFRVGGAHDVLRYVNLGAANRRVRATQHNEASSRSHAVMQLTVEVKSGGGGRGVDDDGRDGGSGHVTYRQAKLSLVDLAGSEKMVSGLHMSKGHFKELRSINQSLSTLGNVVSALSEKGRMHIPYRDSKLTRLLQDSLGGNTRTTIIACINPLAGQIHETMNTLQFADRAKKVMVRIRANEVVDDRVLLVRAQAEIKRLKRRLREALEGTLFGDSAEDGGEDNETANEANGNINPHGQGGRSDETFSSRKKIEDFSPGGSTMGPKGGAGAKDRSEEGLVQPPTVVTNNGQQHLCSTSPGPAVATTAAVLPKFRRRQIGLDEGTRQGSGGEDEAVEDALSADEIRVMVDINNAEAKMAATAWASPMKLEEEKKEAGEVSQLAMFRRELRDGVVSGSFVKLGGGSGGNGGGGGDRIGGGVGGGESGASPEEIGGRAYASDSNVNPDELTDMEVFVDQSQRLEDLMCEAQGRERQRLREGRGRLASVRAERLAMPSPRTGHDGGQTAGATLSTHRLQHPQPQPPPPSFDGALLVHSEHERTAKAMVTPPIVRRAESTGGTSGNDNNRDEEDKPRERTGWAEQPRESTTSGGMISSRADASPTPSTTATTTAMMMAVLASAEQDECSNISDVHDTDRRGHHNTEINLSELEQFSGVGAGRMVNATKPPLEQHRHERTKWMSSTTIPRSPLSSVLRRDSHPSTSGRRQRPATSAGYPPTGGSRASSRSRRIRHRAGGRLGGSRSPIRAGRLAFAEPASPQKGQNDGGSGKTQQHRSGQKQQRQRQQRQKNAGDESTSTMLIAAASPNMSAAGKALRAAGNPPLSSTSPAGGQGLGGKAGGSDAFETDAIQSERGTTRSLTYSVADLGLRLKVYSFRYDHYYECQVVGYDLRRRMHRCAYDATCERHWHDLANKRFEVVGHNGVVVRSTASAPPAPA